MANKQKNKGIYGGGVLPQGWVVKKMKEIIFQIRLGGNYENAEGNSGIPVIKMGNLERGSIDINKIQCLPEGREYNSGDILKKGDLLFNTRNTLDLVGKVAIWEDELPFAVYNSNLLKLNFDQSWVASNYFMNYVFNFHLTLSQLRKIATGTTSVAAIYSRDMEGVKFLLPPPGQTHQNLT
ncbi:MAG: restriction endonuclease subunit S [Chitinophagales bacterium]|nr:restriction endonuclease subunit S [Chitinophagales bacterium]